MVKCYKSFTDHPITLTFGIRWCIKFFSPWSIQINVDSDWWDGRPQVAMQRRLSAF